MVLYSYCNKDVVVGKEEGCSWMGVMGKFMVQYVSCQL